MKKSQLNKALDVIEEKLKQVRIIPDGANDPLPPVPEVVELSEADFDLISEEWNKTMPKYKGMLDAEVINKRNA